MKAERSSKTLPPQESAAVIVIGNMNGMKKHPLLYCANVPPWWVEGSDTWEDISRNQKTAEYQTNQATRKLELISRYQTVGKLYKICNHATISIKAFAANHNIIYIVRPLSINVFVKLVSSRWNSLYVTSVAKKSHGTRK